MRDLIAVLAAICIGAGPATADDWTADRFHLFYSNDSNAAPKLDRWRTVALAGEWVFDRGKARQIGVQLGAEIIAPEQLSPSGIPIDRAFAGILHAQLRDYRRFGLWETRLGAGLSLVGPQTGLAGFLDAAHSVLGGVPVSAFTTGSQVPNEVFLVAGGELAAHLDLGDTGFRPFVEAQFGPEDYVRAGVDLALYASPGTQRMPVTGALMGQPGDGWFFGGGFDFTRVTRSSLIPAGRPVTLAPDRWRVRASASYGLGHRSVDFGLAWLGPEFTEQSGGQFIGTVGLSFDF